MLYTICIALILIASVLIILAVLVQNPKSGMAANFGASNQVMGRARDFGLFGEIHVGRWPLPSSC